MARTTITTREKIISDLNHIPHYVVLEHWDVNKTKFEKGTSGISFDKVKLDEDTKRYIVLPDNENEESESESESEHEEMSIDELILISMIIFAFYRFVHNIGRPSACTILSTCCTLNISNKKHASVFGPKLENIWKDEMNALFLDTSNKFTEKTTTTADNYFMFWNFYPMPKSDTTWNRFALLKTGEKAARYYLHQFAELGVIQLALYICQSDKSYLDLANVLMVYIDDDERWSEMVDTIKTYLSNGPKTVLKHLHY